MTQTGMTHASCHEKLRSIKMVKCFPQNYKNLNRHVKHDQCVHACTHARTHACTHARINRPFLILTLCREKLRKNRKTDWLRAGHRTVYSWQRTTLFSWPRVSSVAIVTSLRAGRTRNPAYILVADRRLFLFSESSRYGEEILLFSIIPRPAPGSTQPPIQWALWGSFQGINWTLR
jgi:hypothetical protein